MPGLLTCFPLPGKPGILTGPRGSTEGQAVPRFRLLGNQAPEGLGVGRLHHGGCTPDVKAIWARCLTTVAFQISWATEEAPFLPI